MAHDDRTNQSAILEVRIPPKLRTSLDELAKATHRSTSQLATDAIALFVAREWAEVEAIEASRAAARAGDLFEHDDVMREAQAIVGAKNGR